MLSANLDTEEVVYSCSLSGMAGLNENDRKEIRQMIGDYKPTGVPLWIKESLSIAVLMIGGGFIMHYYIPDAIVSRTAGMSTDVGVLKSDVASIKSDLGDIKKDIKDTLNRALDKAYDGLNKNGGSKSVDKGHAALRLGRESIEIANTWKIPLGDSSNRFGIRASEVAAENGGFRDAAWQGTLASLSQRTVQPEIIRSSEEKNWRLRDPVAAAPIDLRKIAGPLFKDMKIYFGGDRVSGSKCWSYSEIGLESILGDGPCSEYVRMVGSSHRVLAIDKGHFRNVVFENLIIRYDGGPLILENVLFVNCTFTLPINRQAVNLAQSVLKNDFVRVSD